MSLEKHFAIKHDKNAKTEIIFNGAVKHGEENGTGGRERNLFKPGNPSEDAMFGGNRRRGGDDIPTAKNSA